MMIKECNQLIQLKNMHMEQEDIKCDNIINQHKNY